MDLKAETQVPGDMILIVLAGPTDLPEQVWQPGFGCSVIQHKVLPTSISTPPLKEGGLAP